MAGKIQLWLSVWENAFSEVESVLEFFSPFFIIRVIKRAFLNDAVFFLVIRFISCFNVEQKFFNFSKIDVVRHSNTIIICLYIFFIIRYLILKVMSYYLVDPNSKTCTVDWGKVKKMG